MTKKPRSGEHRMHVRTFGTLPDGSWPQIQPRWIAGVRVTPSYDQPHPSGAPASEFEIVFEMQGDPNEHGVRHSLVLDTEQAHRLTALLTAAWRSTGASAAFLQPDEPVAVGEQVRIWPHRRP